MIADCDDVSLAERFWNQRRDRLARDRVRRASYRAKNHDRLLANNRRWHVVNSEKKKERHLLRKYGLTLDALNVMALSQCGKCFLCRTLFAEPKMERPRVDHNHVTGMVRNLLCCNCNSGLGHFRDDPALLRAAADYIEFHREFPRK